MADRSAVVDARLSRRRRSIERARRRKLLVRASVVLGLAAAVWLALFSPVFRVARIEVAGARHTTRAEVEEAAGLIGRANLFLLPGEAAVAKVEALPWVDSAELERILPGTVRFVIAERRAALQLVVSDGRWLVDAEGRVLQPADDAAGKSLPLLVETQAASLEPGVVLQTEETDTALAVFRSLPRDLGRRLHSIEAATPERVTVVLDGGVFIRYGTTEHLAAKNEVAAAVLEEMGGVGEQGTLIDVRVPASPVVERVPAERDIRR